MTGTPRTARRGRPVWILTGTASNVEENAATLAAVRRGRGKSTNTRGKTPFLDIRLDENKAGLSKVDMDATGPVCADRREEVPPGEPNEGILCLSAIPGKENGSGTGTVSNAENVALLEQGPKLGRGKRVVVALFAARMIGDRVSIVAGHAERGVRLCSEADGDVRGRREVEHLHFPVIDLVELWKWKV